MPMNKTVLCALLAGIAGAAAAQAPAVVDLAAVQRCRIIAEATARLACYDAIALPGLGSDFQYWYGGVQLARAMRFLARHNLVVRGSVGVGHDLPFQQEFTAGGTSQRGWKNNQFRGDLRVTANAEYSVPMFTVRGLAVRGLTFWDASYVTFRDPDDGRGVRDYLPGAGAGGLAPLRNSVGVGTRFYLRQIVLPLLGLDFGYGVERGDYEIYLAIGLTD